MWKALRFGILALFFLVVLVLPTSAKKGKGGGPALPPRITAEQAQEAVKAALPRLRAGKAWVKEGKWGDKKLEVALLLEDKVVGRLRLNPVSGDILPKGFKPQERQTTISPDQARAVVSQALPLLQVGAARLAKNGNWKLELTWKGSAVADITVNGQDGTILTDWKAAKDLERWGK
jgi:hypothetical protein|uniref:PepSY domain-containing protein n=1 Tax=Desulfobacca acetoxidans TaxID=60893 RepID=A0A7C3SLA6_9BACT